jgi:hypothetical protein
LGQGGSGEGGDSRHLQADKESDHSGHPQAFEGLARSKEQLAEKLKWRVQLQRVALEPLWNEPMKTIHPAIDFVDGVAYIGTMMYWKETDDKGRVKTKPIPTVITSEGEIIPLVSESLKREGLQIKKTVNWLPNRWRIESIKMYLEGKANVDPADLYIGIKTAFEEFIEFEDSIVYDFLTLWTIGTYFFHLFQSFPYLYIGGIKQTGKTKLLTLLERLCFNAKFSTDMSTASLFRSIEAFRCTLLLDETENLANPERNLTMRSLILSGNKKGGIVHRTNPNTLQVEYFEVYSPKAFANIKGIEDVLEDRCITLIMKRGKRREIINKEIPLSLECWAELRDRLYLFYLEYANEVTELSGDTALQERGALEKLSARELEIWRPILLLALFFEKYFDGLFDKILEFAIRKAEEKRVENLTETLDIILVRTLLSIVEDDGFYKVSDIRSAMAEYFDEPQKWLTSKWVGNALRRLGFTEKRRAKSYEYFLKGEKVLDLAQRLGVSEEVEENEPLIIDLSNDWSAWINAVYESFRKRYKESFNNVEFYHYFVDVFGIPEKEATNLFKQLVNDGFIFSTYEGVWVWT